MKIVHTWFFNSTLLLIFWTKGKQTRSTNHAHVHQRIQCIAMQYNERLSQTMTYFYKLPNLFQYIRIIIVSNLFTIAMTYFCQITNLSLTINPRYLFIIRSFCPTGFQRKEGFIESRKDLTYSIK